MDENIFDKRRLKTFSNCKELVRSMVGTRDGVIVYNEKFRLDLENTCYKASICEDLQKELEQLKEIEKEHQKMNGELRVEIKELKEKYMKLEDKYIHNVSCCNEEDCDLFCEHQELKKQLEEWKELLNKFKIQQKEFIEFLEKMWKETQDIWYIKILQKYEEIIGDKE